jgi:hypothetical protein
MKTMWAKIQKVMIILAAVAVIIGMVFSMMPFSASAAELEISGWVPYWKAKEGTADAKKNIHSLDVIHPFAYVVKSDGKLNDLAKLKGTSWKRLFTSARTAGVLIVPTVMTSNTDLVHTLLSDSKLRAKHIKAIADAVKKGGFDGIDIDYEGKRASTKDYYSLFLKELKSALGKKMLSCTIEARTPPDSLYKVVPTDIKYANDFVEINKYCDRVNIMAYDQQRADLTLNDKRKGTPYIPVSDTEWVEKVIKLTAKTIDKDKLVLGVATYGAEWELQVAPDWYKQYSKLWAIQSTLKILWMTSISNLSETVQENSRSRIYRKERRFQNPIKHLKERMKRILLLHAHLNLQIKQERRCSLMWCGGAMRRR